MSDVCFFLPHDLMLMKTLLGIVHCDFSCVILSLCIDMHVHKCGGGGLWTIWSACFTACTCDKKRYGKQKRA